jgi:glycerophosphoryl diester phosphodiesterase
MRVIGHRGALALAPENTMAAFAVAERCGVDAIEFDVHLTADGAPVVIHDETLERTTNGSGAVASRTLAQVQALDAGSSFGPAFAGERVPALAEVLTWAAPRRLGLVLELKQPAPGTGRSRDEALPRIVVELVREYGLVERTLFISFDHPSLAHVLTVEPAARVGLLTDGPTLIDPLAAVRAIPAAGGLHVRWPWISRELCDAAHQRGMHVHGWGLRGPIPRDVVRRLAAFGVDSLSADAPEELIGILRAEALRPA